MSSVQTSKTSQRIEAREGFGKPSLILVQANVLKIEDSRVTQCMFCITSVLLKYVFSSSFES